MDGRSLAPLLSPVAPPNPPWRDAFMIEHWAADGPGVGPRIPAYKAVHTEEHLYVEYAAGARELYDLKADPYRLENGYATADSSHVARLEDRLAALAACEGESCTVAEGPAPP